MKAFCAALFAVGLLLLLWSVAQFREARNMHSFLSDEFSSARRVHVYIEQSTMTPSDKRVLIEYFEDMRSHSIDAYGRLKRFSIASGLVGCASMLAAFLPFVVRPRANKSATANALDLT